VTINQAVIAEGQPTLLNDLSFGEYDVVVETGPSYTTKRVEAAESMMAFVQANPQVAPVIGDLIAENMDWPGADKFATRLRKMAQITLPPGIVEPKDGEEPAQPPQAPPDPKAQAEADLKNAQAQGQKLDNVLKGVEIDALLGGISQQVAVSVDAAMGQFLNQLAQALAPQPQPMEMGGMPISPGAMPGIMLPQGQPVPDGTQGINPL
jgi:hypothetical protein